MTLGSSSKLSHTLVSKNSEGTLILWPQETHYREPQQRPDLPDATRLGLQKGSATAASLLHPPGHSVSPGVSNTRIP